MREKPTFWDQVRSDLSTFKMEWQQLQSRVQKLLTPRGSSEQGDLNNVRKAALEVKERMVDIAGAAEIYKQMEDVLARLRQRAIALAEIYGVAINPDDYTLATGPVKKAVFKELPADKIELFDPYKPVGSSNPESNEGEEW